MSATGFLLFIIGIWVIFNANKLVGIINGDIALGLTKPTKPATGGHSAGGSY